MSFDDPETAMAVRDFVAATVREVMSSDRPVGVYASVWSVDHVGGTAQVVFPGETVPVRVRLYNDMHPTKQASFYSDVSQGDVVRIEGRAGARYISAVTGGNHATYKQRLIRPVLASANGQEGTVAKHFAFNTPYVTAGNAYLLGEWRNNTVEGLVYEDPLLPPTGTYIYDGIIKAVITQQDTSWMSKTYEFHVSQSYADDQWKTVVARGGSGRGYQRDFELEIKINGYGFQLRVRPTREYYPGDWTDGFNVSLWMHIPGIDLITTTTPGVVTASAPNKLLSPQGYSGFGSPFLGAEESFPLRQQAVMTGGGGYAWDGTWLSWSKRFICIGGGKPSWFGAGASGAEHLSITMPADGTVIPCYHVPSVTSITVSGGAIPIPVVWGALYYIPDWSAASGAGTYAFVGYNGEVAGDPGAVPSHWLLVASFNRDNNGVMSLKLGTGESIDHWRTVTYQNSWVSYGAGYVGANYRRLPGGLVQLRGLVKSGTSPGTIFTLPVGYRPAQNCRFAAVSNPNVWGATQVGTDGTVQQVAGNNLYHFLDGVIFHTEG